MNWIVVSDIVPLPKALGKCLYVCEFFLCHERDCDLSHCFFGEVSLCLSVFLCREWDHDRDCDVSYSLFGEVSIRL